MTYPPLIFLGAGASAPFNIPPMKKMVNLFERELKNNDKDEQISLWKDVKSRLERVYGVGNVDVEHMLTVFSFPFIDPSYLPPHIIYHYKIDTTELIEIVDRKIAGAIVEDLKKFIYKSCDIQRHKDLFPTYSKLWDLVADRLGMTSVDFYLSDKLEVFTTNYDRCFEIFYSMARTRVKSSEEVVLNEGVYGRCFNPVYYGAQKPKLYKLHGSIRRYLTRTGKVILYDGLRKENDPVDGDEVVKEWMIWPLTGKYIYEYPYSELMHKFRETLYQRNSWLFIGFSFRDQGINLILKDVNDRFEDEMKRRAEFKRKYLILIDRSADKKEHLFEQYNMVDFCPITGDFGKDETFEELKEHGHFLNAR